MNKAIKLLAVAVPLAFSLSSGAANANFSGAYAVSNWTSFSSDGGGSIDTSGAPNSIKLTSSNLAGDDESGFSSNVDFTILAVAESFVSFHGEYFTSDIDGPELDTAGFLLNGTYTQLTDDFGTNSQADDYLFHVNAGDTFGFRTFSVDSCCGSATSTVSNFNVTAVPEPETYAMFLAGLGLMGFMARRRKNGQA